MRPHAIHHIHQRQRIHVRHEPFPHPHPWVRALDRLLLLIAVVAPLVNIPQIVAILSARNAAGVSLLSWSLYTLLCLPWLLYGIVHRTKPIVISYSLWLLTDIGVLAAAVWYS